MESRSQTITHHVNQYLNETRTSMETYAENVVAHYHQLPEALRDIKFHRGGDAFKCMRANGQLVRRFLDSDVRMPVDLEEALVNALPDDRRHALMRDLAARYGLLPTPMPEAGPDHEALSIARLMKETGEVIEAVAPMLADGEINAFDRPLAKRALSEINEAMAELMSLQARITGILPDDYPISGKLVRMK